MNHRFHPLFLGVALAAGASLLGAGCNRQEATSSGSAATTTVGTEIDDTVLTAKATSALLGDPDVKGFDIKVESRKGVLLLSGFVDNQIDRTTGTVTAKAMAATSEMPSKQTARWPRSAMEACPYWK